MCHGDPIMLKTPIAVAALAFVVSGGANAYPTGQLTCQNVGRLAAQTLLAKQSGVPFEAYLTALDKKLPSEAQLERRLASSITSVIYQNTVLDEMKPDDAYAVFVQDCVAAQERDRSNGQGKEDDDAEHQDEDEQ
jgi:hypothetical protein